MPKANHPMTTITTITRMYFGSIRRPFSKLTARRVHKSITDSPVQEDPQSIRRKSDFRQGLSDFFFGMMGMDFSQHALEMRASLESLFMLATVGDLIGVPVLPPYYSLRLLPYLMPQVATWKRRVLREREFSDQHEYHLDGL